MQGKSSKSKRLRIVVAMSGGVDSSTVAGLLVEAGHEVIGIAMKTHNGEPRGSRACCTPDDMRDARRVADLLQIPFYVINYAELFAQAVMQPFAAAYRSGQTPNPCVECNDKVKFAPLLQRAALLEADCLATGHYARLTQQDGSWYLQRAVDRSKDQSYFLYRLGQQQMRQLHFPLGTLHKAEVRDHARRMGLPVADKSESQEICFVGAEGYAKTVEKISPAAEAPNSATAGDIVDATGRVLGQHPGIHHFTLGQRRGLGLAVPEPLYVTGLDAARREVQVGARTALLASSIELHDAVWATGAPPDTTGRARQVWVSQRYHDPGCVVTVETLGPQRLRLHFAEPQVRGAPGQAAVLYAAEPAVTGDTHPLADAYVLGGGAIAPTLRQSALRVLDAAVAGAP
jgi:tRNA-specific 2-thiouridylase